MFGRPSADVNKPEVKFRVVLQLFKSSQAFYRAQRARSRPSDSSADYYWSWSNWSSGYTIDSEKEEVKLPRGADSVKGVFNNIHLPEIKDSRGTRLSDDEIIQKIKAREYVLAIATLQKLKQKESEEKWQWDIVDVLDLGEIENYEPEILDQGDDLKKGRLRGRIRKNG